MNGYRLIPEKYRFLSNSMLKLIAVAAMLADHTASALLQNDYTYLFSLRGKKIYLYEFIRAIGRIAFPIYAFLLVEGFSHTRDRKKFGIRLFLFALVSEIPWNLEHSGKLFHPSQNVFFTLLFGYLGMCAAERLKNGGDKLRYSAVLFALFIISCVLHADYGYSGYGFILFMYLLSDCAVYRAVVGSCFLTGQRTAGLAFIPIGFYNGQRGFVRNRFLQMTFYLIYPLHMLALYFIKNAIQGY